MVDKVKITIGECLGQGSYGKVYSCITDNDKKYAVKIVDCDPRTGPVELLEASIMRTYQHKNISSAVYVNSNNSSMLIFQELAVEDLSSYLKRELPDSKTCNDWCFSLVQAVWLLHSESIIHCDIKTANVLRYDDNRLSLTDFTLSMMAKNKDTFNHSICTLTYRPPEAMSNSNWSYPVDIWSLGCTMYEISTGKLLIPFQGSKVKGGYKSSEGKLKLKAKTYTCVVRWARRRGDLLAIGCRIDDDDDIHEVEYDKSFLSMPVEFRDLILWMTEFDPYKRPTIKQVLEHPYFQNKSPDPYYINSSPVHKININVSRCIERTSSKYTSDEIIPIKAKEIYSRCVGMKESKSYYHILSCVWIASKIVTGGPILVNDVPNTQILDMERKICEYLSYRLHAPPSKD